MMNQNLKIDFLKIKIFQSFSIGIAKYFKEASKWKSYKKFTLFLADFEAK
jgi:hypothetical protein